MAVVAAVAFGAGGGVLAAVRPRISLGWLLLFVGLSEAVTLLGLEWGVYALRVRPGLPLGELAYWLGTWTWVVGYTALVAIVPLVLPDGRLSSRRWRPVLALAVTASGLESLGWALTPYDRLDVQSSVTGAANPVAAPQLFQELSAAGQPLLAVAVVLAVVAMVVRWRRSPIEQRAQLAWVLYGMGLTAVLMLTATTLGVLGPDTPWLSAVALVPFPTACVVAVLRHRLWNLDVVVSRSLLYGALSSLVLGSYLAVVGLLGGIAGRGVGAPVLATAVAALLVLPLHRQLQRLVNTLVHGDTDDPYTALARIGQRLEAAAGPEEVASRVLPEVVRDIARALSASSVALVLADGERVEMGISTADSAVGELTTTSLLHAGARVGRLEVARAQGSLAAGERRRLDDLGRQAAVAVHTVLLARDVQRSREQLVRAREEERRRLRRDLHDGLGPALAAAALQAETARDLANSEPEHSVALLDQLVTRLNGAVADVRAVIHDLRPPTLDELGLAGALRELAARFSCAGSSVRVEAAELTDLPAAVDVAAYHIAAEAVTNAVRHSDAGDVGVQVRHDGEGIRLTVTDDGRGQRPGDRPGVGLRSMRDRAEEVGGCFTVGPGPDGRGTQVRVWLPVTPR